MKTLHLTIICLIAAKLLFCQPNHISNKDVGIDEIPVICYHNITDNTGKSPAYFITALMFENHLKALKLQGYQTVLPEDLYQHIVHHKKLPPKPIIISFDDTRKEHYITAAPLLEKYGYKGAFFIMTVAIGKSNYMTKSEIRDLSDCGHGIGHHTYDHQDLRKLPLSEWTKQIEKPKQLLETITGVKVNYLAYPFGLCNQFAADELKKRGMKMAFQLSAKYVKTDRLYTVRRLLVPGTWSGDRLCKEISISFNKSPV